MLNAVERDVKAVSANHRLKGKRWEQSVAKAKAKIRPEELYFISRHGSLFRPKAHGYTDHIAAAGIFTGKEAASYLDVEGLSVIPIANHRKNATARLRELTLEVDGLARFLAILDGYENVTRPAEPTRAESEGE